MAKKTPQKKQHVNDGPRINVDTVIDGEYATSREDMPGFGTGPGPGKARGQKYKCQICNSKKKASNWLTKLEPMT